jgi:hypothetical protein
MFECQYVGSFGKVLNYKLLLCRIHDRFCLDTKIELIENTEWKLYGEHHRTVCES